MTSDERRRILAVDDNPTNLKLLTLLLASPAYEVRTANDAREALDILQTFRPHLILLDMQLPDMDGLTLTRQLKADPVTRGIPVAAVSAFAMKGDEERARAAGVDEYIKKPVEKQSFRETVARLLARAGETT